MLSKEAALKLDVVQLNIPVNEHTGQTVNHVYKEISDIITEYEEVFQGTGKLKDFQLQLHIDNTVKPVAQTTRKVPYHLQKKVIEKIRELEKMDIIEEINGPTDWVSPLIVTPKKDGDIRIIIDMRRANEARKASYTNNRRVET